MRTQKEIWREEHLSPSTFQRIHTKEPSGAVVKFGEFLKENDFDPPRTRILDIGCGKGRNSIYLASLGFRVQGADFIAEGIEEAKQRAAEIDSSAKFEVIDLSTNWPYSDGVFEAIIDCNATIDMENPGRTKAIEESYRVLVPGGYYLFYGVAPTEWLASYSGPEPNSFYFPQTGKFEKQYSREELLEAYGKFRLEKLESIPGSDVIEGQVQQYHLWVATFQKPA